MTKRFLFRQGTFPNRPKSVPRNFRWRFLAIACIPKRPDYFLSSSHLAFPTHRHSAFFALPHHVFDLFVIIRLVGLFFILHRAISQRIFSVRHFFGDFWRHFFLAPRRMPFEADRLGYAARSQRPYTAIVRLGLDFQNRHSRARHTHFAIIFIISKPS